MEEVSQGQKAEGAAGEQTGKRERGDELAHQPVRHSLWEQGSLEAYDELLFSCRDREVEALQRKRAVYDEAGRQSDGSDTSGSCSDSDSSSVIELEVGSEPPALEGAGVVAVREGELVERGQGPLQPDGRAPAVLH